MVDKITYLLGAGASANAIPVVEKFNQDLYRFIIALDKYGIENEKYGGGPFENIPLTKLVLLEMVTKTGKTVIDKVNLNHTTIDNYARMLYLTQEDGQLRQLKAIMLFYLFWVQMEGNYDKRYDMFLATIMSFDESKNLKLPDSMQILTWNYDFQFELAATNYIQTYLNNKIQLFLNTSATFGYPSSLVESDRFSIIKLNGTSLGWYMQGAFKAFDIDLSQYSSNKKWFIEQMLAYYYYLTTPTTNNTAGIEFAWESSKYSQSVRALALKKAEKTNILVIIGYSFPTFNRAIDRELLSNMKNLKKVYIQTMSGTMTEITERFKALLNHPKDIEIYPVAVNSGREEFYIPYEFLGE